MDDMITVEASTIDSVKVEPGETGLLTDADNHEAGTAKRAAVYMPAGGPVSLTAGTASVWRSLDVAP